MRTIEYEQTRHDADGHIHSADISVYQAGQRQPSSVRNIKDSVTCFNYEQAVAIALLTVFICIVFGFWLFRCLSIFCYVCCHWNFVCLKKSVMRERGLGRLSIGSE